MININIIYLQEKTNKLNVESLTEGSLVSKQASTEIIKNNNLDTQNGCVGHDVVNNDDEDEGEAVDMDAFVESGLLDDDSVIIGIHLAIQCK